MSYFIQDHHNNCRDHCNRVCDGKTDWVQLKIKQVKVEIYNQGEVRWIMNGKLLRENIMD